MNLLLHWFRQSAKMCSVNSGNTINMRLYHTFLTSNINICALEMLFSLNKIPMRTPYNYILFLTRIISNKILWYQIWNQLRSFSLLSPCLVSVFWSILTCLCVFIKYISLGIVYSETSELRNGKYNANFIVLTITSALHLLALRWLRTLCVLTRAFSPQVGQWLSRIFETWAFVSGSDYSYMIIR